MQSAQTGLTLSNRSSQPLDKDVVFEVQGITKTYQMGGGPKLMYIEVVYEELDKYFS